jgi:hypothetical protein
MKTITDKDKFKKELAELINKYSMENGSDTPDFILASYLIGCLDNYAKIVNERDGWFNFKPFQNIIGE